MINYFDRSRIFEGDCYVADYTNCTNSRRGVEISETPFADIPFFHLKKQGRGNLRYLGISFEDYGMFIKGIDNCECCFSSLAECNKPWLMMLETKYCTNPDNIEGYVFKANMQMNETLTKMESLGLTDRKHHNVYFVYAVPGHDDEIPFGAFTLSQNDVLKALDESGIHLIGNNTMLIATASRLLVPPVKV